MYMACKIQVIKALSSQLSEFAKKLPVMAECKAM